MLEITLLMYTGYPFEAVQTYPDLRATLQLCEANIHPSFMLFESPEIYWLIFPLGNFSKAFLCFHAPFSLKKNIYIYFKTFPFYI